MGSLHEDLEEVTDEVFARRAMARQRQITIGKSRPEYKLYVNTVPYHRRTEHMPHTPDPHARISKRAFDRELACWRRGLHVCSAQLEVQNGASPKARSERSGGDAGRGLAGEESQKWADYSPLKDWSPVTDSTRADSEASSPPTRSHCPTPGTAGAGGSSKLWNVKLNLFEHLSPPLPAQSVLPAAGPGSNTQTMPQMIPAMPTGGAWEMYPAAPQTSVVGVMGNTGPAPSAPIMQFAAVDQQQCNYAMPYPWGQEAMPPWANGQQPTPQMQPVVALGQQTAQPMQNVDSGVGSIPEEQMQQQPQLMWEASAPQPSPGTPRSSKNQADETPSTPLNRVVRSISSPAVPSPWTQHLRTPSPDHGHYNMTHFKASQQPTAPNAPEADPWAGACLMVTTQNYFAESDGYLTVAMGSQVRAMVDNPHCGDSKCAWPTYCYCYNGAQAGWVPQQLLWRCYVDDSGRRWACDDATGTWCWVDEIGKNQLQ
jgi:hypothetical protein